MEKQISTEWVTIATVYMPQEAYLIKSVLEEEDIPVFLKDEHTALTYSNPIGGIKIQVPDRDAARAGKLLTDGGYIS